jgi:hypothetical protein
VPFGGPKPDPRTIGVFPWTVSFGSDVDSDDRGKLVTDEDGRFEVSGLLPNLTYGAQAVGPPELSDMFTSMGDGDGPMIRYGIINVFGPMTIKAGEMKDIGNVTVGKSQPDAVSADSGNSE